MIFVLQVLSYVICTPSFMQSYLKTNSNTMANYEKSLATITVARLSSLLGGFIS